MKNNSINSVIKKVPVPLCGVMLGFAALGNLLQSYNENIRYICGIVSAFLLVLVLLKLILFPNMVKEDMKNPIVASVSATFPMSIMLLSTYVKPWLGVITKYIWFFAIGLHIVLIIYFTVKFILKLQISRVFASYYILYVGIVVAAVTAPVFETQSIGSIAFWFGFITLLILLTLVTIRYVKYREIPEPAKPLICIYAAPTSLCVAGYIQSVSPKSVQFLLSIFALASILYVFALIKSLTYLKLKFYPSYAAFTFPFVISAIATKQTMACLANMNKPLPILQYVIIIETIIAIVFVLYVFICFMRFIFSSNNM